MNKELSDDVVKIKENIRQVVPRGSTILVKVEKEQRGIFQSLIRVKIPGKKTLLAYKREYSEKLCLYKSYQAILRQVIKFRSRSPRVVPLKVAV